MKGIFAPVQKLLPPRRTSAFGQKQNCRLEMKQMYTLGWYLSHTFRTSIRGVYVFEALVKPTCLVGMPTMSVRTIADALVGVPVEIPPEDV